MMALHTLSEKAFHPSTRDLQGAVTILAIIGGGVGVEWMIGTSIGSTNMLRSLCRRMEDSSMSTSDGRALLPEI